MRCQWSLLRVTDKSELCWLSSCSYLAVQDFQKELMIEPDPEVKINTESTSSLERDGYDYRNVVVY